MFLIFLRTYNLIFLIWLKDLCILECKFRFCMQKSVYSHLETSGDAKVRPKTSKIRLYTLGS